MKTERPEDATSATNLEFRPQSGFLLAIQSHSGSYVLPINDSRDILIGRSNDCDVTIEDRSVSRRHAILHLQGETSVEALNTPNHTVVDGQTLDSGSSRRIRPGSIITLGTATIIFQRLRGRDARPAVEDSDRVVIHDPAMLRIFRTIDLVAPTALPILILGETGSGKEIVAARIHERSDRAQMPFVKINCAALAESLLESELFGYEKGAFTGATSDRIGLIESSHRGTVFLDEIGEIPVSTQVKLLRSVETGEICRIGGVEPISIDFRIICATNRPLIDMVREGTFREDLYYRLNGTSIEVPPLRRRPSEIIPLAELFVRNIARRDNRPGLQLTGDAREALCNHPWPGNIRELLNVVERAAALCQASEIRQDDLAFVQPSSMADAFTDEMPTLRGIEVPGSHFAPQSRSAPRVIPSNSSQPLRGEAGDWTDNLERTKILAVLEDTSGNQTRAAELLGISRRTLINKMIRYGIKRPRAD